MLIHVMVRFSVWCLFSLITGCIYALVASRKAPHPGLASAMQELELYEQVKCLRSYDLGSYGLAHEGDYDAAVFDSAAASESF